MSPAETKPTHADQVLAVHLEYASALANFDALTEMHEAAKNRVQHALGRLTQLARVKP